MNHTTASRAKESGFIPRRPSRKGDKGFTLIELLVVIAIIGLLSSVVLASLNNARQKARDTRRLADIRQYVNALELFYSDNNRYPENTAAAWHCLGTGYTGGNCWGSTYVEAGSLVNAALSPAYIPTLPAQQEVWNAYGYLYRCSTAAPCQNYQIEYFLEQTNQRCVGTVYSPNYSGTGLTLCIYSSN